MDFCGFVKQKKITYILNELPKQTKAFVPFGMPEISDQECMVLKKYAKARMNTFGFENNIIVPPHWSLIDDEYLIEELASGVVDYVDASLDDIP